MLMGLVAGRLGRAVAGDVGRGGSRGVVASCWLWRGGGGADELSSSLGVSCGVGTGGSVEGVLSDLRRGEDRRWRRASAGRRACARHGFLAGRSFLLGSGVASRRPGVLAGSGRGLGRGLGRSWQRRRAWVSSRTGRRARSRSWGCTRPSVEGSGLLPSAGRSLAACVSLSGLERRVVRRRGRRAGRRACGCKAGECPWRPPGRRVPWLWRYDGQLDGPGPDVGAPARPVGHDPDHAQQDQTVQEQASRRWPARS